MRVWERRYGFPVPERSPSGHRRFSKEQVGVLRSLANLARSGHSIGELIGEYMAGKLEVSGDDSTEVGEKSIGSPAVDLFFEGDMAGADRMIDRQVDGLTPLEAIEQVIEPALIDVGERWFRKEAQIFQERYATSSLLNRLVRMLDQARRDNPTPKRTVLIGAVEGDHHEGGVLMVCVALESAGWRGLTLGVNLPVSEFDKAVQAWRPDALAISFVLSRNVNKRFHELSKIQGVPVFVGGRSVINHQGLARRHGLIPLIGSLRASSALMISEVEARERRRARLVET